MCKAVQKKHTPSSSTAPGPVVAPRPDWLIHVITLNSLLRASRNGDANQNQVIEAFSDNIPPYPTHPGFCPRRRGRLWCLGRLSLRTPTLPSSLSSPPSPPVLKVARGARATLEPIFTCSFRDPSSSRSQRRRRPKERCN